MSSTADRAAATRFVISREAEDYAEYSSFEQAARAFAQLREDYSLYGWSVYKVEAGVPHTVLEYHAPDLARAACAILEPERR